MNQEDKYIEAGLLMIYNPLTKLSPSNRETTLHVYNRVVKQLNKLPDDKNGSDCLCRLRVEFIIGRSKNL